MDKNTIADTLKSYRKASNLSVNDVCSLLKRKGIYVSTKTIYGWENAYSQPDADTLMFLCKLYKIKNVLEAFGYDIPCEQQFEINDFEKKLLLHYRNMPEMQKPVQILLGLDSGRNMH